MRKQWFVMIMTIALIIRRALVQATDSSLGIANKQTIVSTARPLLVAHLLPAGEYQVLHQMDGTVHIMVFKGIAWHQRRSESEVQPCTTGRKGQQNGTALYRKRQERACLTGDDVPGRLGKARPRAVSRMNTGQGRLSMPSFFVGDAITMPIRRRPGTMLVLSESSPAWQGGADVSSPEALCRNPAYLGIA